MEPARPRADRHGLCGPRAGRLQGGGLHFAIWRMCHLSAPIPLSSLQPALIADAKFLLCRNVRRFCGKFGRILLTTTAGTSWHYVLMLDHVHLFARPEIDARSKAAWVQMWKGVSSRRITAALFINPPIWQSEYFDRYLRSSENYSAKWYYVEQNAVRAGLVETVEAWPYRGTIHDLTF